MLSVEEVFFIYYVIPTQAGSRQIYKTTYQAVIEGLLDTRLRGYDIREWCFFSQSRIKSTVPFAGMTYHIRIIPDFKN